MICSPASVSGTGTLDLGICCMQAARSQFPATITDTPWAACGVDPDFDFSNSSPSPSVNVTMRWCRENCGGWQASTAEQWLQPLASWIIPALALLILFTVGEDGDKSGLPFGSLGYQVKEYIILLGDPASAICGALSELCIDTWLATKLMKIEKAMEQEKAMKKEKEDDRPDTSFDELVIGFAMLTSQTLFRDPNFPTASEVCEGKDRESRKPMVASPSQETTQSNECVPNRGSPSSEGGEHRASTPTALSNCHFKDRLLTRIKIVLKAKIDFVNGVALPVVLALAATASTFHDAYLRLGDNETAHNLAFGIWFSWLLVLAVMSNSYVASVNPGLAHEAIGDLVEFSQNTLPLRKRAKNTIQWSEWVVNTSVDKSRDASSLPGYLIRQVIGWICVGFACACAAAITYKTVPVGIGCRSFTFLIYGLMTFVVASLTALRDWVKPESSISKSLRYLYGFLVGLTAIVLILSVLAELVGLYRNCWCMHFGAPSDLVELSTGTELSIQNATVTWIPLGMVAYTGVWIVCTIAVGFRTFVNFRIQYSYKMDG